MAVGRHRFVGSRRALRPCFLECDSPVVAESYGTAPASAVSSCCRRSLGGSDAVTKRFSLRTIVREIADDPVWRNRFDHARNALTKPSPELYYDVLSPLCSCLEIWETEYYHVMDSPQAIVNWFRGSGLRPYLEALENDEQRQTFEARLLAAYTQAYPRCSDGQILFPFRRCFFTAYQ